MSKKRITPLAIRGSADDKELGFKQKSLLVLMGRSIRSQAINLKTLNPNTQRN
jgi:hypothetical protein